MATNGGLKVVGSGNILLEADRHNHMLRSDSHNALNIIGKNLNKQRINNGNFAIPGLDAVDETNSSKFTIAAWVEINAYTTGYAWYPLSKWNNSGTNSATIILYAFQDYRAGGGGTVGDGNGNNDHGQYGFYYHRSGSGGWTGKVIQESDSLLGGLSANQTSFPRKNFFVFTYDVDQNSSKPIMYVNGVSKGDANSAVNGIGNYQITQGNMSLYTNYPSDGQAELNGVTWIQIYDRMITEKEQKKIYDITKEKHGY